MNADMVTLDRILRRCVEVDHGYETPCWVWQGYRCRDGYGRGSVDHRTINVHRWVYSRLRVEIPGDLQTDHLCRIRACCNPWHLEPVTNLVNVVRGARLLSRLEENACSRGHSLTDAMPRRDGGRRCRQCQRIYEAAHRERLA